MNIQKRTNTLGFKLKTDYEYVKILGIRPGFLLRNNAVVIKSKDEKDLLKKLKSIYKKSLGTPQHKIGRQEIINALSNSGIPKMNVKFSAL